MLIQNEIIVVLLDLAALSKTSKDKDHKNFLGNNIRSNKVRQYKVGISKREKAQIIWRGIAFQVVVPIVFASLDGEVLLNEIVAIFFILAIVNVFGNFVLFFITYQVSQKHLEIYYFGLPIKKVLLDDIVSVSNRSKSHFKFGSGQSDQVSLLLKNSSSINITPERREEFITDLLEKRPNITTRN